MSLDRRAAATSSNVRLRGVLGAALTVMLGFVASRLLGLARNVVISHQYGASREYEAFLAAISIPDAVFQVLAGGAVGAAFIPVFTSYVTQGEMARAWRLTSALMNIAAIALGAVSATLAMGAPFIMTVLVPGWSAADQQEAAALARLLLISPAVFAVSTLASSALNGLRRFALASAAPLMYNLSIIIGAIFLRPLGVEGLAISAVAGAFLHLVIQVPGLIRAGMRYRLTFGRDLAGAREVARLMGPRIIGLGISQINQLVTVVLASFLVVGSIAYLSYAWLILMVPLGVFAMAVSTAVFPTFAEQNASSRHDEERQTFLFALRLILYLTIPAMVIIMVLGQPIVSLLLERGAFDANAAGATAFALAFFAIGLPGHAVIEIVDRVFYAERDTATPVRVAAMGVTINVLLSVVLMRTELSFGGLALANSLAALTEAAALTFVLDRRRGWLRTPELASFIWRTALAAAAMGLAALLIRVPMGALHSVTDWAAQAVLVLVVGGGGALAYLATSTALGVEDVRRVAALLRSR
ncbi:MAG: putative lipid flippase MurJ [Chloroflexi bacterium]|nr:putative lipid flippase MurJ [Chloroflexota bacterium]